MSTESPESHKQAHLADELHSGRIAIVLGAIPLATTVSVVVGSVLATVQWRAAGPWSTGIWLGTLILINALRVQHYLHWRPKPHQPKSIANAGPGLWWGAALSGMVWGAGGVFLFPPGDIAHQFFLSLCLAGMAAGSVTTLSALFPAAATFLVFALVPLGLRFFSEPDGLRWTSGSLVGLFLTLMLVISFRLYRIIGHTLQDRYERKAAEEAALRRALYDDLTGLPNRRLFLDRLERALVRSERHGTHGAVVFLDLDNFKNINDSLGHRTGDLLLQEAARRILSRTRKADTAARLGGDEFVLLLPDLGAMRDQALEGGTRVVSDLRTLLSQPFQIGEHQLHVSASAGVALFPSDGHSSDEILQHADVAMYRAKDLGRDGVQFFVADMREVVDRRLTLQRELRDALEGEDELFLAYHPQVDVSGAVIGAEALLRWRHPRLGVIHPPDFIGIAEETGLILPLGARVMELACRDLQQLDGRLPGSLAVNISPRQFRTAVFINDILTCMRDHDTDPRQLQLEITETCAMTDPDEALARMEKLRDQGLKFVIDSFGVGFSSLARLRRLPVAAIKIDRSFIRGVLSNPDDAIIVETIIAMARHLGIEVIAQGVESEATLAFLAELGCSKFQGYHFSHPMALAELIRLLHSKENSKVSA